MLHLKRTFKHVKKKILGFFALFRTEIIVTTHATTETIVAFKDVQLSFT